MNPTGSCICGAVAYHLTAKPLFVHCCHCTWCQRETGSAFVLNGLIETRHIALDQGVPLVRDVPSASGNGQTMKECAECGVVLWSHYSSAREKIAFLRVGTLDNPNLAPPDIHVFTATRQDWVLLPDGVPSVAEFYDYPDYWRPDALARRAAALRDD